ncbi:MAG: bifunctional transaldolase/phosoglucose isomerase [Chloroflexi bacterium]|nr:bifunctional transaldolase/phosoglucose isomerase [Chloroflexota bacterium]
MNPLFRLRSFGQSPWLDYIRRGLITSGGLQRLIDEYAVSGVTSNPTILNKAISGSTDYDDALRSLVEGGERDPKAIFLRLAVEDIGMAADVLRPVYDDRKGGDGFVSLEVSPNLAQDTEGTIREGVSLFTELGRPNVMIKVPGTPEGVPAIEELTARGVNVNVTLLFDVKAYEQAALAYIAGLERRLEAGQSIEEIAGVASFFVSRVDTAVDALLPDESPLRGKVAVANAKTAYRLFRSLFSGPRWERLAAAGGRLQRPLWASTGTKNPSYSDVLYVEELIGAHTVNTMPESTLYAFADHGRLRSAPPALEADPEEAEMTIGMLPELGVDLDAVLAKLLEDGLAAFQGDFEKLLAGIEAKCERIVSAEGQPRVNVGSLAKPLEKRLSGLDKAGVPRRIWALDHTVWKPDPTEISDRLGWLALPEKMHEHMDQLQEFAESCAGFERIVLLGMGGSSLAPEVFSTTFGGKPLTALDTTHPEAVQAAEKGGELRSTLFIVASKSGGTVETLSHFAYFFDKVQDASQFVAITDPGTPLEALSRSKGFRRVFLNPADIGGRYSALSYFGLVPAALIGVDVHALLDSAEEMASACAEWVPVGDNPGLWLGALMGEAARAGRDKLTLLIPDEVTAFGAWLEQLIAESTGKEDIGIVPVDGEPQGPPDVYGDDRLFVSLGVETALEPSVVIPFEGADKLGAEFFRWEFATAVAGHVLGIHPFDQPNVQEAKDATRRLLEADALPTEPYDDLGALLEAVRPGDYLAIQAYLPRTADNSSRLQAARMKLRDHLRVATTLGFGPRFLHSTGQLHKGGPSTGVFIQVVDEPTLDLPIPGKPYTFRRLLDAQSAGDLQALRARDRRVARVRLSDLEEVL